MTPLTRFFKNIFFRVYSGIDSDYQVTQCECGGLAVMKRFVTIQQGGIVDLNSQQIYLGFCNKKCGKVYVRDFQNIIG